MANSVKDFTAFSGALAAGDLLHVIDVSEVDPQDRSIRWDAFVIAVRAAVGPTVVAAAPTAGDDSSTGEFVGAMWLDSTGPTLYMCTDATEGAAVWRTVADWS